MIYIYMLAYLQGLKFGVKFGGIAYSPASATFVRWLRELNALQLQKTHANRKSTSKSGKHLHQFDSRWCKCSQHIVVSICSVCVVKLTKVVFLICRRFFFICCAFLFGLCCEHLQHVRCKIEELSIFHSYCVKVRLRFLLFSDEDPKIVT